MERTAIRTGSDLSVKLSSNDLVIGIDFEDGAIRMSVKKSVIDVVPPCSGMEPLHAAQGLMQGRRREGEKEGLLDVSIDLVDPINVASGESRHVQLSYSQSQTNLIDGSLLERDAVAQGHGE